MLSLGDGTFAPAARYAAGTRPWGLALGDLDGDLDLDLVVVNRSSDDVSVFSNLGDGTFEAQATFGYPGPDGPRYVRIADLDGDLDLDLAVGNEFSEDVAILLDGCDREPFPSCPEDLDADGRIGIDDLIVLLSRWGTRGADVDGDGVTGLADLVQLLAAWGSGCRR